MRAVILVVSSLVVAPPVVGQELPPPIERPARDPWQITVDSLSNGLRYVVTEDRSVPWVTVQILVDGGAAADPADMGGLSDLVARTIFRGTATRSPDEVADTLASLGASASAISSADWITIGVSVISPLAGNAIGVVADVVRNPTFPIAGLESARTGALAATAASWAEPRAMAGRVLRRSLYGREHPYGRDDAIHGLAKALVTDVRGYHSSNFRPGATLVSLAGDLTAADARLWLSEAFGDWRGRSRAGSATIDSRFGGSGPGSASVTLVHLPGATRAVIRVGQTLAISAHQDWLALEIAHQIIGGTGPSRLARRFAADSLDGSVFTGLTRQVASGIFQVGVEVPAEVADQVIGTVFDEISRFVDEGPTVTELMRVKRRLAGSIPLQRESSEEVARQVGNFLMLGLPWQEWAAMRGAIDRLTREDVHAAARRHLRPYALGTVIVGDATILRSRVAGLGPLTIEDAAGQELGLVDLTPAPSELTWDTRRFPVGTWEYRIMVDDAEVGTLVRTVDSVRVSGQKAFVMASIMITGEQRLIQSATFTAADFRPLQASFSLEHPDARIGAEVIVADGVLRGTRTTPDGRRESFEVPMVHGALVGEMLEAALWILPHEPGYGVMLPVMQVQSGASARVEIGVAGRSRVSVPAGSFDAYLVEITGDQGVQVAWVAVRSPHVVLRLASPGRPEVLELVRGSTVPRR